MRFPSYLFRRIVSSGQFMPELDGLRAVAILPVVLFHATMSLYLKHQASGGVQVSALDGSQGDAVFRSALGWLVSHGFLGVQLFYLISGFVVTLPFARHHLLGARAPRLQAFYVKRLTRIEPPYVIALLLLALGVLAVAPENFRIADFASGLVYLRTALFGNEPWAFFISWSLEIEVQFYLLVPLLASVFAIRNAVVRRVVLITAIASARINVFIVFFLPGHALFRNTNILQCLHRFGNPLNYGNARRKRNNGILTWMELQWSRLKWWLTASMMRLRQQMPE
jgi:peptidoglycan/LPS O-acetylase OafA/YrhL